MKDATRLVNSCTIATDLTPLVTISLGGVVGFFSETGGLIFLPGGSFLLAGVVAKLPAVANALRREMADS